MEVICANLLCAKSFKYKGGPVHFVRSDQHYCSRKCQNTTHGQAGTPKHKMWGYVRKRAHEKGIVFTLEVSNMPDIPKFCPVLGIELQPNDVAGPTDSSPSLDRLVPELGYVPGNVRVISFRANRLRSNATAKELMLVAQDAVQIEGEP